MSPEASEKTDMSVETRSKESVEKPDMTGQVTKALETEVTQERVKEVNGRRFTYRSRYKDGPSHALLKDWFDEDGHSIEWWEKKALLRDWIYGRMSPEEFDAHFPHYMGPPKEWYRITKEALAMPEEEKESLGPKESDELHTQHYANNYGDGSGLPLRPGMGLPDTEGEAQNLDKDGQASNDCVDSLPPEEFSAQSPGLNKSNEDNPENPEDLEEGWNEEEVYWMVVDDTERRLREEYLDCLGEEHLKKGLPEAKPRYASYYGDGSGLPLRPGMGPPMTEEESRESLKKLDEQLGILSNMNDEEFHAQHPEHNAIKDCCLTEEEAEKLLEGDDDEQPRYANSYGDGSGLPLRPGMGPPMTEEEEEESLKKWKAEEDEFFNMSEMEGDDHDQPRYAHSYGDGSGLPLRPGMGPPKTEAEKEESLKKWEAEGDKIFNMSEEEFDAKFPGYKDIPVYLCPDYEGYRLMEEFDEDDSRRREEMIRKWKESRNARPEDKL